MTTEKNNHYEELLVKYITGTADKDECEIVVSWIRQSPENKRYFDELKAVYEVARLAETKEYNTEAALNKVKMNHFRNVAAGLKKSDDQDRRVFWLEFMKYAALIIFISLLGFVGYSYTSNRPDIESKTVWNTIEAPFGSRAKLTLNDGTKVWLNAGSKLQYPADFNDKNRKVYLTGEAYFDVSKDESKQFIVSTPHIDVKVFGTRFNVKAYDDENSIQTTLVEGSVSVESKGKLGNRFKKVLLKPNESATYYINEGKVVSESQTQVARDQKNVKNENIEIRRNINPIIFTSWKDDRWLFDGEPLSSLAVKLERRYNVKISIPSEKFRNYKFSGIIKDETLEQVLKIIKLSAPVDYKIENNQVELLEIKSFKNTYDDMLIKNN